MSKIKRYFKRFKHLSLLQKKDITEAIYRLSSVSAQLKYRSIDWFWEKCHEKVALEIGVETKEQIIAEQLKVANNVHESIRLASRLLPFSCECVPRSIVLRDMLREKGITAQIIIGVNKANLSLQSHAWVEVHDRVIGEREDLKTTFKSIDVSSSKE